MKKIINILIVVGFVGCFLSSCRLDEYPTDRVMLGESYQTMNDAESYWNGLYSIFRIQHYGVMASSTEVMSDLYNLTGGEMVALHRLDNLMLSNVAVSGIWGSCYTALANINNFIDNVDQVDQSNIKEDVELANIERINNYKGDAHYFRAYMYYLLVKHYGDDYEPSTAATKLGVPLVLHYNVTEKPARATLKRIYDFIMEEIIKAEGLVQPNNNEQERVTPDAVAALKSKIQLLMHDYVGAAATASSLFGRYTLTDSTGLSNGWLNDDWSEDIFQMSLTSNEVGEREVNTQNYLSGYMTRNGKYSPTVVPTDTVIRLYEQGDYRRAVYLSNPKTDIIQARGVDRPGVYFIRKWRMTNRYTLNSYAHKPKVARIAEQYLIAAEAMGAAGGGIEVLKKLRDARGATLEVNAGNFVQMLRDEWVREMIGEGVRVECLKRWHIGFNGRSPQNEVIVIDGKDVECPADYYRLTLPIPASELQLNSELQQAEGWGNLQ
ncbi:MAG: RagB/SusD family nutrient uptake outer membrane protein [Bacteroidales bacterium]|jgi:hypothetical protein|nr:RagB/SusD family nutrient uptake outer membrane protein [Bacteroidales bacterium]